MGRAQLARRALDRDATRRALRRAGGTGTAGRGLAHLFCVAKSQFPSRGDEEIRHKARQSVRRCSAAFNIAGLCALHRPSILPWMSSVKLQILITQVWFRQILVEKAVRNLRR